MRGPSGRRTSMAITSSGGWLAIFARRCWWERCRQRVYGRRRRDRRGNVYPDCGCDRSGRDRIRRCVVREPWRQVDRVGGAGRGPFVARWKRCGWRLPADAARHGVRDRVPRQAGARIPGVHALHPQRGGMEAIVNDHALPPLEGDVVVEQLGTLHESRIAAVTSPAALRSANPGRSDCMAGSKENASHADAFPVSSPSGSIERRAARLRSPGSRHGNEAAINVGEWSPSSA